MIKNFCKKNILVFYLFIFLVPSIAGNFGLSVTYGDMSLTNLKIGATYNIRELIGYPFQINFKGDKEVGIEIEIIKPEPNLLRRKDIEPIPDISWIQLTKNYFWLKPGESGYSDIILKIPDKKEYMGKKFQVTLNSHTKGAAGKMVGLAINTNLILEIAPEEESEKEREQRLAKELTSNISFNVIPDKIFAYDVPVGRKIDLKKEHKLSLKIINAGDNDIQMNLKCIPVNESEISAPKGYETPSVKFLILEKDKMKIPGNEIREEKIFLNFPDDAGFKNKKYFFVIKIEPLDQPIKISYYVKVYVQTIVR